MNIALTGQRRLTHADVGLPSHTHRRGFDALETEHDYRVETVQGGLPADFAGTLFRNGPGRNRIGGRKFGHWFDGDGMLSRITFRDGEIHYCNRYVRTPKYMAETAAQKILYRGFGTQKPGGVLANIGRPPANVANTSVVYHAGKLLTLWEGGHPWEIDPATMSTVGEYDYDGVLKFMWPFSAHGKLNPATGEYVNFGVQPGKTSRINVYRISPKGQVIATGHFPLKAPVFLHDFALTENHAVFFIGPVEFHRMWRFLGGLDSLDQCMAFNPSRPSRVLVVDLRTMSMVVDSEIPAGVFIHYGNSFEENGKIVTEVTRYPDFAVDSALRDVFNSEVPEAGDYWRYTIDLASGKVDGAPVPGLLQCEFPVFDARLGLRRHRYTWMATMANNGTQIFFNSLQKYDAVTGDVQTHDFGPGRFTSEPLFMPRHETSGEDEGYLASVVYDYRKDLSEVVVLDAADITKTVAVATLKHHVPFGFHGCYVPKTFA
ncbi:MAG: carotenoid oxygenase family protein [Pseudomonadota bacterium]